MTGRCRKACSEQEVKSALAFLMVPDKAQEGESLSKSQQVNLLNVWDRLRLASGDARTLPLAQFVIAR